MYIHLLDMATKCITITEDAYEMLNARKGSKDSFSDVIKKHFSGNSLMELAGVFSKKRVKELREDINKTRVEMDKEINERVKRIK